jgi:agmatinase
MEEPLKGYDPDGVANTNNNIFGLPFGTDSARLVIIPVPWDVTTSRQAGTAQAPQAVFDESFQIDLFDPLAPDAWREGMAMEAVAREDITLNKHLREKASVYIRFLETGGRAGESPDMDGIAREVNQAGEALAERLKQKCLAYLDRGQIPFVLGGEHSVPLGLLRALAEREPGMGILQIDAHADLRLSYQGFSHSHASIMRNALELKGLDRLVQVGLRELCPEEMQVIREHPRRIRAFFDQELQARLFQGEPWERICRDIVRELPPKVYVSFDLDGLDPAHCPGTGTPVPGGLSYNQALYLLETLVRQGRQIIGADLVEAGTGPVDTSTACRLLYRMAGMMIHSAGKKGTSTSDDNP